MVGTSAVNIFACTFAHRFFRATAELQRTFLKGLRVLLRGLQHVAEKIIGGTKQKIHARALDAAAFGVGLNVGR